MRKKHGAMLFVDEWEKNFAERCLNVKNIESARLIAAFCALGYTLRGVTAKSIARRRVDTEGSIDEMNFLLHSTSPMDIIRSCPANGVYDNRRSHDRFPIMMKIYKVKEDEGIGVKINAVLLNYLGMSFREFKGKIIGVIDEAYPIIVDQFAHEEACING